MPSLSGKWVFRIGLSGVSPTGHRWMCSETWLTEQAEPLGWSNFWQAIDFLPIIARYKNPFGDLRIDLRNASPFWEQIYPTRVPLFHPQSLRSTVDDFLNPNAPEAALRLQRVGVNGGRTYIGRICIPIPEDFLFTDLPHRRHVDAADLQANLVFGNAANPNFMWPFYRQYTNVIVQRRTLSYVPVTSYAVKENPVRLWQRYRTFTRAGHHPPADDFVPNELKI